jgi:predicted Zn-dependent protease with MMP-like domain
MKRAERERFDALLEEAIGALPDHLHALIEEAPVIVDDRPTLDEARRIAADIGEELRSDAEFHEFASELCGLHTGVMLTERSVEDGAVMPTDIRLFREGIVAVAGGWDQPEADDIVYEEIMITLLHELGHHFGLEEEDLEGLGYG